MLPIAMRKNSKFQVPKPTMLDGIGDLIQLFKEQFTESKFRDCINRTFIKTGTLPVNSLHDDTPVEFVIYKKTSMSGTMLILPEGTLELDHSDVNDNSDDMTPDDLNLLEKAVISYYVDIIDSIDDDCDSDESDSDNM